MFEDLERDDEDVVLFFLERGVSSSFLVNVNFHSPLTFFHVLFQSDVAIMLYAIFAKLLEGL